MKNGGYEIVQRYHVAEQLQNLLQRLFSVSIKVEILGETAVSTESYQQMQETAEKTVSKHTEQLQATASAKSSDKAEPAKSKPVALSVELENIVPAERFGTIPFPLPRLWVERVSVLLF